MANCPHTSFKKGKKILIIFKDDSKAVDKYIGHKSDYLLMERLGRLKVNRIRSTSIHKKPTETKKEREKK